MATTAWQFNGTEGADNAVLTLIQLQDQQLIDVQDVAVIRWPQYAAAPMTQEHVTEAGTSKVSSLMQKMKHATIEGSMIENVLKSSGRVSRRAWRTPVSRRPSR